MSPPIRNISVVDSRGNKWSLRVSRIEAVIRDPGSTRWIAIWGGDKVFPEQKSRGTLTRYVKANFTRGGSHDVALNPRMIGWVKEEEGTVTVCLMFPADWKHTYRVGDGPRAASLARWAGLAAVSDRVWVRRYHVRSVHRGEPGFVSIGEESFPLGEGYYDKIRRLFAKSGWKESANGILAKPGHRGGGRRATSPFQRPYLSRVTKKITILESNGDIAVPAGSRIYYQGSWDEKPLPDGSVPVAIEFQTGTKDVMVFQDHVIPEEFAARILKEGVVTQLDITYPRADKYNVPLAVAAEKFARALVGSFGFAVSPDELQVVSKDHGEDGGETYSLTVWVSQAMAEYLRAL